MEQCVVSLGAQFNLGSSQAGDRYLLIGLVVRQTGSIK
jgi:hypothetical protein